MKINTDKAASKIANGINGLQQRFVQVMDTVSSQFSSPTLKAILIVAASVLLSINTYFVIEAFNHNYNRQYYKLNRIHFVPLLLSDKQPAQILTMSAYYKLVRFHQYMDSLRLQKKTLYDSILSAHPGLMDSILQIEKMYSQQNN